MDSANKRVHFVILSLTGWANTQNDLHNHSGDMGSVNRRQHYLKPSLNLAGAIPRMITGIYSQLLSFKHILNLVTWVQLKSNIWSVGLVQVACNPGLRSGAWPSAYYYCLHSNYAQWLQQWLPPPRSVCDQFICYLGISGQ